MKKYIKEYVILIIEILICILPLVLIFLFFYSPWVPDWVKWYVIFK